MKFAIVNEKKIEPQQGLSGTCQGCGKPVIAKCGNVRIHHWAHRGKCTGDSWWEPETEWHRTWKGHFPVPWQEVRHLATNSGEVHIADVKTDQGRVLEFQHSPISPEERQAREAFYKTMVWVIDGTRRIRDKDKFNHDIESSNRVQGNDGLRILGGYRSPLLRDWSDSTVPVFFDLGEEALWGILPKNKIGRIYAFKTERKELIASLNPEPKLNFEALVSRCTASIESLEWYEKKQREKPDILLNGVFGRRRR